MLSKDEYSYLKNSIYAGYLFHLKNPDDPQYDKFIAKLHNIYQGNTKVLKIIDGTVEFPFDLQLAEFIGNKKLDFELFNSVINKFNISERLVKNKISEYVDYPILVLIGSKEIDPKYILKLNNIYFEQYGKISQDSDNKGSK